MTETEVQLQLCTQTTRALVRVLLCYGALEIVSVIIIIITVHYNTVNSFLYKMPSCVQHNVALELFLQSEETNH